MVRLFCLVIAILEILITIRGYEIIYLFRMNTPSLSFSIITKILAVLFFTLNWVGAFGLYKERYWGFIISYLAIIFSTIAFSMSYLPGLHFIMFGPLKYRFVFLLIGNFCVLAFTLFVHRNLCKLQIN